MKEDKKNSRHAEGMRLENEVLHFSRGDDRAYIVTDGLRTRTYMADGVFADKSLTRAITRLECMGFRINMQVEVRVPDSKAEAPDGLFIYTARCGGILKTEIHSWKDITEEDEQEEG